MLKRLYIDNFRCFVNFEYKPERKQLLLGANGSGKSSLLDAIRVVREFVAEEGLAPFAQNAFKNGKTRWSQLPKQIFQIEAEIEGREYLYRLEVLGETRPFAVVHQESLEVDGSPIIRHSDGIVLLYSDNAGTPAMKLNGGADRHSSMVGGLRGFRQETKTFVEWLSNDLNCLRIDPHAMSDIGQLTGQVRPAFDMSDLTDWYMRQTGNDIEGVFQLRTSLPEVLDGFASLNFRELQPGSGNLIISFNKPAENLSFRLMELSDGQRCLIALYMILHFLIAKGHTVFLDEPDNFLSLREIQPWLLAAEDAIQESKGQLILISHHPEILNQWANDYGVLFVREQNGQVAPLKPYKTDYDGVLQPSEVVARGWENE
jgi:predicted ATPase